MATTTIRISDRARQEARALADATGKPMSQVIEEAIRAERRRLFWQQFRVAAAGVTADREVAAEENADLALFEGTLLDGLEDEPIPR